MKSQLNRRRDAALFLVALLALLFIAGDYPLLGHWGDVASSNSGTLGSKWIHTGTTGVRYGLWGESASSDARGVFGHATSTSGTGLAIGVYGESDSPNGRGVNGYVSDTTGLNFGTVGATWSDNSYAAGVYGNNEREFAGSSRGVQGLVRSAHGYGVIGFLAPLIDGYGAGVHGINSASTGSGAGIEGYNSSANGWAGRFTSVNNGVAIYAAPGKVGLTVSGGSKNASVATSDGDRLLYSEESTEVWFSDYGFGQVQDGFTLVRIDPKFAETVDLDNPYHVFLQSYGNAQLYVGERRSDYFEVWATDDASDRNAEFSYRIVAKRRGFEDQRLEFAPWVTADEPYYQAPPPPEPPPPLDQPQEGEQ